MANRLIHGVLLCVVAISSVSLTQGADAQQAAIQPGQTKSAEAGVRNAIDHYFRGHATGDATHLRKAFLPTAHIEGIRDGSFTSWTLDEYCSRFSGKPAPDEGSRVRTVDSIDVVGNAAMVKATLDHGSTVFTDYFVLLNVGGEWKIANKVYYAGARRTGRAAP